LGVRSKCLTAETEASGVGKCVEPASYQVSATTIRGLLRRLALDLKPPQPAAMLGTGPVLRQQRLNGLINEYHRAA
jgi:hypothetical protein